MRQGKRGSENLEKAEISSDAPGKSVPQQPRARKLSIRATLQLTVAGVWKGQVLTRYELDLVL